MKKQPIQKKPLTADFKIAGEDKWFSEMSPDELQAARERGNLACARNMAKAQGAVLEIDLPEAL